MEEDNKKKKKGGRIFDRVMMGAVIGGAIGSVIGASIAPNKGKKTREDVKNIAKKAKRESEGFFNKIKKLIIRKKEGIKEETKKEEEAKKIPHEHV